MRVAPSGWGSRAAGRTGGPVGSGADRDLQAVGERQAEGQARAKAEGRYHGRPENKKRNDAIAAMLKRGSSWSEIQAATRCSRSTIAKIAKRQKTPAIAG